MTSKNRGEIKSLFITQVRPFKPASNDTIARQIRETLPKAGIDARSFHRTPPGVLQVVQPKRVIFLSGVGEGVGEV